MVPADEDVSVFTARQALGHLIDKVNETGRPLYLTHRGRRVAILAPLPGELAPIDRDDPR